MCRFLLSAVSIFVLLFTTFLLPQSVAARRCPVVMPSTLLSLYRTSDAIYVGRYEKSVEGEVTEDTPEYSVVPIKKHYSVSSALKGETRKMLTLDDTEYRYKNHDPEAVEEETEDQEIDEDDNEIRAGDQVLIFVSKDEEESGAAELANFDAIKKMTPDRLSSYETRIRELNGIFASKTPSHSEVVDWLIRCAEDPNTRWEGAFELLQSFQNMEWEDEREQQAKQASATEEKPEEVVEQVPEEEATDFRAGDSKLARIVTDTQKGRLTNILLGRNPKSDGDDGKVELISVRGDRELIELVTRWGDPDLASNLLEQLRNRSEDAGFNSQLMASIASVLKDDELAAISSEYSDLQWESGEDEVDAEDEIESDQPHGDDTESETNGPQIEAETGPVAAGVDGAQTADEETAVAEAASHADTVETESPKKKKTFAEVRSELLTKFLARADTVVATERNKNSAKLNN